MRLTVEQLRKVFGDVVALDDITYTFLAGRIYGLVGENGAGKSTFVRILAGHIPSTAGSITLTIGSVTINHSNFVQHVSAVPQSTHFVEEWDALRNVFLGSEVKQWDIIRADQQRSKIAELEEHLFPLPSGKPSSWTPMERTRVAVFRALIRQPHILIVDEALAALEGNDRIAFRRFLRRYTNQGRIVLVVSHDIEDVQRRSDADGTVFFDEVLAFRQGTVTRVPPSASLLSMLFDSDSVKPDLSDDSILRSACSGEYLLHAEFRSGTSEIIISLRPGQLAIIPLRTDQQVQDIYGLLCGLSSNSTWAMRRLDFNGKQIARCRLETRTRLGMRFIPPRKEDRLSKTLSTLDNLHLSRALGKISSNHRRKNLRPELVEALSRFKFVGGLDASVQTLSGGNQQKLVLAQILDDEARCVVAANVFAGLDVRTQYLTVRELQKFCIKRNGTVILLVSDLVEIRRLALDSFLIHQ